MSYVYLITPFLAWLTTGLVKFSINCLKQRRLAFDLIGYGGMPSNHSSIVSSIIFLVALREGLDHPAFGVALTFGFIVVLDANGLRNQVAKHANLINKITGSNVRSRVGHTKLEIFFGVVLGLLVSIFIQYLC